MVSDLVDSKLVEKLTQMDTTLQLTPRPNSEVKIAKQPCAFAQFTSCDRTTQTRRMKISCVRTHGSARSHSIKLPSCRRPCARMVQGMRSHAFAERHKNRIFTAVL
ncbi:unnamed protein product [Rhodiola kirilowii]